MALLAKQGRTHFEHCCDAAAMRDVAVGTVFSHWVMLMHKGAAFFGVAGVAGGVDAVTLGQFGAS
jgi:hypothetical protein